MTAKNVNSWSNLCSYRFGKVMFLHLSVILLKPPGIPPPRVDIPLGRHPPTPGRHLLGVNPLGRNPPPGRHPLPGQRPPPPDRHSPAETPYPRRPLQQTVHGSFWNAFLYYHANFGKNVNMSNNRFAPPSSGLASPS